MVEFALVLLPLCIILFAIVEFGMAFWRYQQVSAAASEGARRAAVSRTAPDRAARVTSAVRSASPQLTATSLRVTTTSSWTAGSDVTVTVRYPEEISVMGMTLFNKDLVGRRTMKVEQ